MDRTTLLFLVGYSISFWAVSIYFLIQAGAL